MNKISRLDIVDESSADELRGSSDTKNPSAREAVEQGYRDYVKLKKEAQDDAGEWYDGDDSSERMSDARTLEWANEVQLPKLLSNVTGRIVGLRDAEDSTDRLIAKAQYAVIEAEQYDPKRSADFHPDTSVTANAKVGLAKDTLEEVVLMALALNPDARVIYDDSFWVDRVDIEVGSEVDNMVGYIPVTRYTHLDNKEGAERFEIFGREVGERAYREFKAVLQTKIEAKTQALGLQPVKSRNLTPLQQQKLQKYKEQLSEKTQEA